MLISLKSGLEESKTRGRRDSYGFRNGQIILRSIYPDFLCLLILNILAWQRLRHRRVHLRQQILVV